MVDVLTAAGVIIIIIGLAMIHIGLGLAAAGVLMLTVARGLSGGTE